MRTRSERTRLAPATSVKNAVGSPDEGRVLHVVGGVTDEVFSFLGPAARILAKSSLSQTIIVLDDPRHRDNVQQLKDHATLRHVDRAPRGLVHWHAMYSVCVDEVSKGDIEAIHVHGLLPCIAATFAMRATGRRMPMVYSPHGSRSLGRFRFVGRLAMMAVRSSGTTAIVTVPSETQALADAELVESPVHDAFFAIRPPEGEHPVVVSGGRQNSPMSVQIFSQLAVLLSGEELGLGFRWLGMVDDAARGQLAAADVNVTEVDDVQVCAESLAAGWVYVAPWQTRGFPLFLAQAMAVGLPCVAFDCEQHRSIIEHGKTGFLCSSEHEMVQTIARLMDDPALRRSIGTAGRALAAERFATARFSEKLMTAYSTRW